MSSTVPEWIQNHIDLYKSEPEKGHLWDSTAVGGPGPLPCLLLTTTGRRSGKERTMPLLYGQADDGFVIVASKGGAPKHPAWYLNLSANPTVKIQVAAEHFTREARTVGPEKRAEYWADGKDLARLQYLSRENGPKDSPCLFEAELLNLSQEALSAPFQSVVLGSP